ncbi:NAD-binding protein [Desulfonatronospira sp.]|uniref:potassium channel family protein n=3 Tax=Desulfonatronospira sp. TaxID=1962951 RepID=UPI0025BC2F88|nr:NAD-binding protein [Desulfonatronospira sp.]
MKFIPSILEYFFEDKTAKNNILALLKFVFALFVMMLLYTMAFHGIMLIEGQEHTILDGLYWTAVTMSTLGYGDITFHTDLGRMFSVLVLLSGVIFLLVMLPFTFIRFFYAPWLEAHNKARTPRELPEKTAGHVLISNFDPMIANLVEKLKQYSYSYCILVQEQQRALELHDQGYKIMLGDLDDLNTYRKSRADKAELVLFNNDDHTNTNAVFTLRELSSSTQIIATAETLESMDILNLAGASQVHQFPVMLGQALARRVLGVSMHSNVMGRFGDLLIAETPTMRTPLVGKKIIESRLRETTGVNVVGIWERGSFQIPHPDTRIGSNTVLVLAGSQEQLEKYDEIYGIYNLSFAPVIILGGGRVGRAAADTLAESDIDYRIVEKSSRIVGDKEKYVLGNAADYHTLKRAGIDKAPSIIITTNNDDLNIYLTIYCRKLHPKVQIISRATRDRSVSKLHQAGADLVMSYASMGANSVINFIKGDNVLMVAEGLDIFKEKVAGKLHGKNLGQSDIRMKSGCNVIAIESPARGTLINPEPDTSLEEGDELILIGTSEAEKKFLCTFKNGNQK